MGFRDNSALIRTAATVNVEANGADDVYSGASGATAFVIADGAVGDDNFLDFGSDDSLITGRRIFDGNGDGYIQFGANGVLDVDRTSARRAGEDQLQLVGGSDSTITEIRYLGSKGGQFVYADAGTRRELIDALDGFQVVEGTVADDTLSGASGATAFLYDNALGLNLGGDVINGFGNDDLLVTTSKLFDRTGNDIVTFSNNLVLDLSGANGPQSSDPATGPGGQIDLNAPNRLAVSYLGEGEIDGVTYYYYGTAGSDFTPFDA